MQNKITVPDYWGERSARLYLCEQLPGKPRGRFCESNQLQRTQNSFQTRGCSVGPVIFPLCDWMLCSLGVEGASLPQPRAAAPQRVAVDGKDSSLLPDPSLLWEPCRMTRAGGTFSQDVFKANLRSAGDDFFSKSEQTELENTLMAVV